MTVHSPPKYLVYTLRCWEERGDMRGGEGAEMLGEWRFALIDVQTGQRYGFGGVRQVAEFLEARLEQETEERALITQIGSIL